MADAGFDFAVWFVHGIGQQKQGETLSTAGLALVEWLQRQPGNQVEVVWARLKTRGSEPARANVEGQLGERNIRFLTSTKSSQSGLVMSSAS